MSSPPDHPVFGLVLFGGPLSGALVRDVRLANELATRGYEVHVWWAMDRPRNSPLHDDVQEHWLFTGMRYSGHGPRGLADAFGRFACRILHDKNRARSLQKRPRFLARVMEGLTRRVVDGVEKDAGLIKRFSREMTETGVTHMLPMLAILCPWVDAARAHCPRPCRYMVTFQGYELYVNYARSIGKEQKLYARLREAVDHSDWPAIAVSADYLERVAEDIGVPREDLVAIPPGVPVHIEGSREAGPRVLATMRQYQPDIPVICYLGRRDAEKGLDLLLYAATILFARGRVFQLIICGPTLFGSGSKHFCEELAENLRCPVIWRNHVPDEMREALFFTSRCVVYPSIHREPFGMVAAEVMAHGTPAVVPDYGGVADVVEVNGEAGGLKFRVWDSGDLADTLERLLVDDDLHRTLSEAAPRVAAVFSIELLADRVLAHLGLADSVASDPAARPPAATLAR